MRGLQQINHYNDPGSLLNNQYFMESIWDFFPWLSRKKIQVPLFRTNDPCFGDRTNWMSSRFQTWSLYQVSRPNLAAIFGVGTWAGEHLETICLHICSTLPKVFIRLRKLIDRSSIFFLLLVSSKLKWSSIAGQASLWGATTLVVVEVKLPAAWQGRLVGVRFWKLIRVWSNYKPTWAPKR